jgi:hypothetical protein
MVTANQIDLMLPMPGFPPGEPKRNDHQYDKKKVFADHDRLIFFPL